MERYSGFAATNAKPTDSSVAKSLEIQNGPQVTRKAVRLLDRLIESFKNVEPKVVYAT